jgi:hypothetical protein
LQDRRPESGTAHIVDAGVEHIAPRDRMENLRD